jgi:hypothetical protein
MFPKRGSAATDAMWQLCKSSVAVSSVRDVSLRLATSTTFKFKAVGKIKIDDESSPDDSCCAQNLATDFAV